jgi:hypothetical protein
MRQKSVPEKEPVTQVVRSIRRAKRRHASIAWVRVAFSQIMIILRSRADFLAISGACV